MADTRKMALEAEPPASAPASASAPTENLDKVRDILFGSQIKQFPSPFDKGAWYGTSYLSPHQVGTIFVALCIVAALFTFFRFTTLGLKMRAAAQNPGSSRLLGVNVGRMLMLGWGLAGAIGAIAGMMVAPVVFLDPGMMTGVLIYAFAGALIGGIDNPVGAIVGGFLVGVLENLIGSYIVGTELKLSVALVLIVGVLVVRPAGLMGRVVVKRVEGLPSSGRAQWNGAAWVLLVDGKEAKVRQRYSLAHELAHVI